MDKKIHSLEEEINKFQGILIDSFEPKKIEELIIKNRIAVKRISFLSSFGAGDYCYSDVVIERKTLDDLWNTLVQGRLWDQLFKLKEVSPRPILVIIGRGYPYPWAKDVLNKLKQLIGAKVTIVQQLRIPILEYENDTQFVLGLVQGYFKSIKKTPSIKPLKHKKHIPKEIREDMISRLPGISSRMAKNILTECKDILGFCNMSEKDLIKHRGISKKKALLIRKVLHE